MPRPKAYLFDIDGTLIATGGVGRRALERTFESRDQRPPWAFDTLSTAGAIDVLLSDL